MTDSVTPARSLDQRMVALGRANVVRVYRAGLKKNIAAGAGDRSVVDVVREPLPVEDSWKVFDLLLAMPKVGRIKADKMLRREGISPSKTVRGLSTRQRQALLAALPSVGRGMVRS